MEEEADVNVEFDQSMSSDSESGSEVSERKEEEEDDKFAHKEDDIPGESL